MKLQVRAKQGQAIRVMDENGAELEGVIAVQIRTDGPDQVPTIMLVVRPVEVVIDGDATVETLPPAKPATDKGAKPGDKGRKD